MAISDQEESPPQIVDGVTIYAGHKDWAMGEVGPCLIVLWRGVVTEAAVLQINDQILSLTERYPGKCAYLNVIEQSSPPPKAPLRKIVMAGLTRPGKALTCLVAVIEGNPLRSALVRAIMTGMALLGPQGQATKFFGNTADMSLWVNKRLSSAEDPDRDLDIVRAAEVSRRQMPA